MQVLKNYLCFFSLLVSVNFAGAADHEIGDLESNSEETAASAGADSELAKTKAVKQGAELDAEIDQALAHLAVAGLDADKYLFLKEEQADESVPAILQKEHELDGQLDFEITDRANSASENSFDSEV